MIEIKRGRSVQNVLKAMHKPLFIVTIIILIVSSIIFIGRDDKVIGEVYGAEHEYMKIGEDTYTECDNPGVAISTARNKRLGTVVFRNTEADPMVVWSIKGYDNNEYVYALWVYEGAFYKKDSDEAVSLVSCAFMLLF